MTCIAGVTESGTVWIGADSASTDGWYGRTILAETKTFKVGPFVMGFSGMPRHAQVIRHRLEVPRREEDEPVDHYMMVSFVDAVRTALRKGGVLWKHRGEEGFPGSYFLVGYEGKLWRVEETFQMESSTLGYDAIGSGGDLAMGALFVLRRRMKPRARILAALAAAAEHNAGVAPPFHVEILKARR